MRHRNSTGSSPLARGPHGQYLTGRSHWGLIPARAGTTGHRRWCAGGGGAHPRSRGDHAEKERTARVWRGSSPLARGPRASSAVCMLPAGLIPARAGTTLCPGDTPAMPWAHPRSRGDHYTQRYTQKYSLGSSPLARGPRTVTIEEYNGAGLIPARAGTTSELSFFGPLFRAHPRSRGDHPGLTLANSVDPGSSPLARGPRIPAACTLYAAGLIPARAGTTRSFGFMRSLRRAHPRSRGDHIETGYYFPSSPGSSPLARGPRGALLRLVVHVGLIPARAGTTRGARSGSD